MSSFSRQNSIVIAVACAALFFNLGKAKLWDRDEPRNARCAVEMMERHDWIVPTFNGELRTHKPVLLYWLTISAYKVFGVNEFSARFWSAMLAVGTAFSTYLVGRRLFDATVGVWAAIILVTTLMFQVVGRAATPDSALIFFSTAALAVFVRSQVGGGDQPIHTHVPTFHILVIGWLIGLAMLTKGPVGVVLPVGVIISYLTIASLRASDPPTASSGDTRMAKYFRSFGRLIACAGFGIWRIRPCLMLAIVVLFAAPWYLLVGIKTDGEWLRGFFWEHNIGRATAAMEGHHGSLLYYPIALLVGFFPWSVFAVPVGITVYREIRNGGPWKDGLAFPMVWLGVIVGVFSMAQTKLPNYITPAYPAVALIVAVGLRRFSQNGGSLDRGWYLLAACCLAVVGLAIAVGLPIAAHVYFDGDPWLTLVGLIPITAGVALVACLRKLRVDLIWPITACCAFAFCLAVLGIALPRAGRHQAAAKMVSFAKVGDDTTALASFANHEPSWVFYAGQDIPFIPANEVNKAVEFLKEPQRRIITTTSDLPRLQAESPFEVSVLAKFDYFLRREKLVVVARHPIRLVRAQSDKFSNSE